MLCCILDGNRGKTTWVFSSTEAFIETFYDGIHNWLNRRFRLPNLQYLIMIYCSLLVFGLKCTGFNFDQFLTDEIFDNLNSKIEDLIEKTGVKLVVFVNDIVRVREKPDPLQ